MLDSLSSLPLGTAAASRRRSRSRSEARSSSPGYYTSRGPSPCSLRGSGSGSGTGGGVFGERTNVHARGSSAVDREIPIARAFFLRRREIGTPVRRSGADKGRSADGAEATHPDIDRKRRPLPRCREHASLGRVESRLDRVWVAFGRYARTHCQRRGPSASRPPRRARSFSRTVGDRTPWPTRPSCRRRSPARGGVRRARRGGSRARGRRGRRRKRRAPSCQSAGSAGASERSTCQATWLVLDILPSVSLPFRRAFLRSALPRQPLRVPVVHCDVSR